MSRFDPCDRHGHPRLRRPVPREKIRSELGKLYHQAGYEGPVRLDWPESLGRTHDRNWRRYAQVATHARPPAFELAPQTRWLPARHRRGLLAHEIGHVLEPRGTEDDADVAAWEALGIDVGYDHRWPGKGLQVARNPEAERAKRARTVAGLIIYAETAEQHDLAKYVARRWVELGWVTWPEINEAINDELDEVYHEYEISQRHPYLGNPDPRRRQLEREAAGGDVEAQARVLVERMRAGELLREQVEIAASLGDPAAVLVAGPVPVIPVKHLAGPRIKWDRYQHHWWASVLFRIRNPRLIASWAADVAEHVLPAVGELKSRNLERRTREVVDLVRSWLRGDVSARDVRRRTHGIVREVGSHGRIEPAVYVVDIFWPSYISRGPVPARRRWAARQGANVPTSAAGIISRAGFEDWGMEDEQKWQAQRLADYVLRARPQ